MAGNIDGELKDPLKTAQTRSTSGYVSRLHQLVAEVEKHMDDYDIPNAMSPILPFLDDA